MSTVDPSIPLSGKTGFDVPQYLEVASLAQQMRQKQTQMQSQNALSQLLANPQSYDAQGNLTPIAQRSSNAFSPQFALQYRQQQIDAQLDQAKLKAESDEAHMRKLELSGSIADASEKAREDTLKAGGSQQASIDAATQVRNKMFDESGGIFSTDEIQKAKSTNYDPMMAAAFKRFKPGEIQEERLSQQDKIAQRVAELGVKKEEVAERGMAEREREDRARDAREEERLNRPPSSTKPPTGFEWDPEKPGELKAIPGGPKDPNSKPWTGREKVYAERIMGSAVEGAQSIKNITELPVGATTGLLGIGAHPGTGVLSAPFSALKNKVSDQEVQDYNTMTLGLKRNLGAVEAMGLAPPGSLTEGMDAVILRPGDSQLTKLRRLAEARQVIEFGLKVPLADPAIPDVLKDVMRETINKMQEAVPYTQHDVTELEKKARSNPETSLEEFMKQKGLDKSKTVAGKTPPLKNSKGWVLHKDAKGNMAYVGPNKEVEPVQ